MFNFAWIMKRLYFFLPFIVIHFFSSQKTKDFDKEKIFDSLEKRVLTNAAVIYNNGKEMLKYAQSDYEYARCYHTMGDGKYKDGDFLSAIKFLEKADDYAEAANATDLRMAINSLLVSTYRYAGLPSESDAKLEVIKKIVNKNDYGEYAQFLQVTATALEIDKKFCEAIPYRLNELDLYQTHFNFNNYPEKKDQILIFANVNLSYNRLKCGNLVESEKNMRVAENLYHILGKKSPTYYIENYYLTKALLTLSQKDINSSKSWFRKSYESAKLTENKVIIKRILNEMRNSQVFNTPEEKNNISEALLNLQNSQTKVTEDVTTHEVRKKDLKIKNGQYNRLIYGCILILAIIVLLALFIYYQKRNKKLIASFQKILDDIEAAKSIRNNVSKEDRTKFSEIIKSSDTEKQILKNLDLFEKSKLYNTRSISISQMAVMLKTNNKYVSFILKKHRNSTFYNYINTCRINYITELLKDNPKLLQYKISAISEMCGFASHTQFTIAFKAITGISPSQYIYLLQSGKNNEKS